MVILKYVSKCFTHSLSYKMTYKFNLFHKNDGKCQLTCVEANPEQTRRAASIILWLFFIWIDHFRIFNQEVQLWCYQIKFIYINIFWTCPFCIELLFHKVTVKGISPTIKLYHLFGHILIWIPPKDYLFTQRWRFRYSLLSTFTFQY